VIDEGPRPAVFSSRLKLPCTLRYLHEGI